MTRHGGGRAAGRLSRSQLQVLALLVDGPADGPALVHRLDDFGSSVQGVHRTAASLVRRGYATKHTAGRPGGSRVVRYTITDRGRQQVAAARLFGEL